MKFALVENTRHEPFPKLRGVCPTCGTPVLSKCGHQKMWHWAHVGKRHCDYWWEPETIWHRSWKSEFEPELQEVRRSSGNDIHIADVVTLAGTVLEFQHSSIPPNEVLARELFYKQMVWIVDGQRLKNDLRQFNKAISGRSINLQGKLAFLLQNDQYQILRRWQLSERKVYLDFGDATFPMLTENSEHLLWQAQFDHTQVAIVPVTRQSFVEFHRGIGEIKCLPARPEINAINFPTQPNAFQRYSFFRQRNLRKARF